MFRKILKATIIPLLFSMSLIVSQPCYPKTVQKCDPLVLSSIGYLMEAEAKRYEKEYTDGWTTTVVNVRQEPNTESDILDTYMFNTKVSRTEFNEDWDEIKYGDSIAYMCKKYISNEECEYVDMGVPYNSGFKSYMPYTAITSRNSPQYKLQEQSAYTGNYGIRQVNGRYCVAIGSYYTSEIGTLFDLILENGTVIPCILADQKADKDTDSSNIMTMHNGCVSEFVVDTSYLKRKAKQYGDISYCDDSWNSPVETIRLYK